MYHNIRQIGGIIAALAALSGCAESPSSDSPAPAAQPAALETPAPPAKKTASPGPESEVRQLASRTEDKCNPAPDASKTQHILGYGGLIQGESRKRGVPSAGEAYPVMVEGFRRGWFAKGGGVGFDTTYLGVVAEPNSHFNGVVYEIPARELTAMDAREYLYCRVLAEPSRYVPMRKEVPAPAGQVWIYVSRADSIALASARFPVVQSYVDVFVTGCLEQQERFAITDYAKLCLQTTTDWPGHWVNDRLFPRRPFIHQPKAGQIDTLLKEEFPKLFEQIRLEGR